MSLNPDAEYNESRKEEVDDLVRDCARDMGTAAEQAARLHRLARILDGEFRRCLAALDGYFIRSPDEHLFKRLQRAVLVPEMEQLLWRGVADANIALAQACARVIVSSRARACRAGVSHDAVTNAAIEWALRGEQPLRSLGTSLLVILLRTRSVADFVVASDLPATLLQRLAAGSYEAAPPAAGEAGVPPATTIAGSTSDGAATTAESKTSEPPVAGAEASALRESGGGDVFDDGEAFGSLRDLQYTEQVAALECVSELGEYHDMVTPTVASDGLNMLLRLMREERISHPWLPSETLQRRTTVFQATDTLASLVAHRRLAYNFVQICGVEQLLELLERYPDRCDALVESTALCFYGFACQSTVFSLVCERSCFRGVIAAAIRFLSAEHEPARRFAANFFSFAFSYNCVLSTFEALGGAAVLIDAALPAADNFDDYDVDESNQHHIVRALQLYLRGHVAQFIVEAGARHAAALSRQTSRAAENAARSGSASLSTTEQSGTGRTVSSQTTPAVQAQTRRNVSAVTTPLRQRVGVGLRAGPDPLRAGDDGSVLSTDTARDSFVLRAPAGSSARWRFLPRLHVRGPQQSVDVPDRVAVQCLNFLLACRATVWSEDVRRLPPHLRNVQAFVDAGGVKRLLRVVHAALEHSSSYTAAEHALDALALLTPFARTASDVCNAELDDGVDGISLLLDAATHFEVEAIAIPAMRVMACLVGPYHQPECKFFLGRAFHGNSAPVSTSTHSASGGGRHGDGPRGAVNSASGSRFGCRCGLRSDEAEFRAVRSVVRRHDGLKVGIFLLEDSRAPAVADDTRLLACHLLCAMARDEEVAHILQRASVDTLLSEMVRSGVPDVTRRVKFEALRDVAFELISLMTAGGASGVAVGLDAADPTMRKIEKRAIVNATRVQYSQKELLSVVHEHLIACGLRRAAIALDIEAGLGLAMPARRSARSKPRSVSTAISRRLASTQSSPQRGPSSASQVVEQVPAAEATPSSAAPTVAGRKRSRPAEARSRRRSATNSARTSETPGTDGSGDGRPLRRSRRLSNAGLDDAAAVSTPRLRESDLAGSTTVPVRHTAPSTRTRRRRDAKVAEAPPLVVPPSATAPRRRQPKRLTVRSKESPSGEAETPLPDASEATPTGERATPASVGSSAGAKRHAALDTPAKASPASADALVHALRVRAPRASTHGTASASTSHSPSGTPRASVRQTRDTTLGKIVTSYLRQQHAQCEDPIAVLPPFSLRSRHECPRATVERAPHVAAGVVARQLGGSWSGVGHRKFTRRFRFSRFRYTKGFHDTEGASCVAFMPTGRNVAVGSRAGSLSLYDPETGTTLASVDEAHASRVWTIEAQRAPQARASPLLLSTDKLHNYAVWRSFDAPALLRGDNCVEAHFGNVTDRMVLAEDLQTRVLDLPSGRELCVLRDPGARASLNYTINSACFSPLDDMILADGVLYDPRMPAVVHKFDKLTSADYDGATALFHPSGLDVLIRNAVWDLRALKLRMLIPHLETERGIFSSSGEALYCYRGASRSDYEMPSRKFTVLDGDTYREITTVEDNRLVMHLAADPLDSCLAVVDAAENSDSNVRLLEIGRPKVGDDGSDDEDGQDSDDDDDGAGDDGMSDRMSARDWDAAAWELLSDGEDGDLDDGWEGVGIDITAGGAGAGAGRSPSSRGSTSDEGEQDDVVETHLAPNELQHLIGMLISHETGEHQRSDEGDSDSSL